MVSQTMRAELDLDIEALLAADCANLPADLKAMGFDHDDLDRLAEIMVLLADDTPDETRKAALRLRAVSVLEYVEREGKNAHFSRYLTIRDLKRKLGEHLGNETN